MDDTCGGGCCTKITGLSVNIGRVRIVSDVDLHLHCGEFTVVMGPNGAGKTTLLRAIAGEIPFTGEILFHRFSGADNSEGIDASSPQAQPSADARRLAQKLSPRIGYVPQKLAFDPAAPMTVEDLFALCLSKRPRWLFRDRAAGKAAVEALSAVDAAHLISKRLGHLSGGELQRVILSLALTPRPDILLLDEPVSGIDASGQNLFYEMVSDLRAKHDLSIIMVSHDLARSARYADRLVFFDRTVLCAGRPSEVLGDDRVQEFFGGTGMIVCGDGGGGVVRHHGF